MTSDQLRALRLAANLSQQQLGEAMGFPEASARGRISEYETGKRRITPAVAVALKSAMPSTALQYWLLAGSIKSGMLSPALKYLPQADALKARLAQRRAAAAAQQKQENLLDDNLRQPLVYQLSADDKLHFTSVINTAENRDLDLLVARYIPGLKSDEARRMRTTGEQAYFAPTIRMEDFGDLVEAMRKQRCLPMVHMNNGGRWQADLYTPHSLQYTAFGTTINEAMCRAALTWALDFVEFK